MNNETTQIYKGVIYGPICPLTRTEKLVNVSLQAVMLLHIALLAGKRKIFFPDWPAFMVLIIGLILALGSGVKLISMEFTTVPTELLPVRVPITAPAPTFTPAPVRPAATPWVREDLA